MIFDADQFHDIKRFISVTTEPTDEPVTVDELKQQARIDTSADDGLIAQYITTARRTLEKDTQRALMTQTVSLKMDAFPIYEIYLERAPVQSVSSIQYVDTNGTTQTLSSANYTTDLTTEPARIVPYYGLVWPFTRYIPNAVIVTFVVGYTVASLVPAEAKQAIMMLAAHWYRNRESTVIGAVPEQMVFAYDSMMSRLRWSNYA